jgi:uncharacterized membrane protein
MIRFFLDLHSYCQNDAAERKCLTGIFLALILTPKSKIHMEILLDLPLTSNGDNCIAAVYRLLVELKVPVTKLGLSQYLQEHPDYPSLLSISDVLKEYKVNNVSFRTNIVELQKFTAPLLIQFQATKNEHYQTFKIIREISNGRFLVQDEVYKKGQWLDAGEFADRWTGVILLAEASGESGEKEYELHLAKERRKKTIGYFSLVAFLVSIAVWSFSAIHGGPARALVSISYLLLVLMGCGLGLLLLWYELDQHNPLLRKICSSGRKTNCTAVLQSKGSKIGGISWSVVGLTYFAGCLLLLMAAGAADPEIRFLLCWLSIAAAPYTVFSLYYQWRVAKQWCVLCLSVQAVLLCQVVITLSGRWLAEYSFHALSFGSVRMVGIFFLLTFLVADLLLLAYKSAKEGKANRRALQQLKHNPELFETILASQPFVGEIPSYLGLLLGNPGARNRITKVCNPYCGPCSDSHFILDDLFQNNPDIQLQIIYDNFNREDDIRTVAARHFLAIAEKVSAEDELVRALDEWYGAKKKDYLLFSEKYPMNGEIDRQHAKMEAMKQWCESVNIQETPTFFINGYRLPDTYTVQDLKYFFRSEDSVYSNSGFDIVNNKKVKK